MAPSSSSFSPRDTLLLIALALIWGNSFLFIKVAVAEVGPQWLVAYRMALGALLLAPLALGAGQHGPREPLTLASLAFIGIVGVGLGWTTQAWAQQFLDSGLVAVLNATTPVATLVLAVLAGQERMYLNRVLGLGLAVAGAVVVVDGEMDAGRSVAALVAAVASTLGYASATVVTRGRVSGRVTSQRAAAIQLSLGALVLGPLAFATQGPPPVELGLSAVLAVLALGSLGTGLGFLIYFALVERVGATNASMVTYLVPVVGLTSGALFRGERFGHNVLVGALTMIAGVWLSQRAPKPAPALTGTAPPDA